MMPDGDIYNEHIVLNDITMWSGSEDPEAFNTNAINYLPEIRALLLEGKTGRLRTLCIKSSVVVEKVLPTETEKMRPTDVSKC